MKVWLVPVLLQVLALGVGVAEVFIPSLGLLSAIALGLLAYSLFLAYTGISATAFYILLGTDILVLPLVFIAGLKILAVSPLALKKKLSSREGVISQAPGLETHLNKTGRTLTTLRPSGTALIDGVRLDVVADGDYIEADTPVRVAGVTGNQVIVERKSANGK